MVTVNKAVGSTANMDITVKNVGTVTGTWTFSIVLRNYEPYPIYVTPYKTVTIVPGATASLNFKYIVPDFGSGYIDVNTVYSVGTVTAPTQLSIERSFKHKIYVVSNSIYNGRVTCNSIIQS